MAGSFSFSVCSLFGICDRSVNMNKEMYKRTIISVIFVYFFKMFEEESGVEVS